MQRDTPPLAIELALYNKAASCYLPFFFLKKKKTVFVFIQSIAIALPAELDQNVPRIPAYREISLFKVRTVPTFSLLGQQLC